MINFKMARVGIFSVFTILPFLTPALSPAQESNAEFGKKFFDGKCARCHAKDGTGNPKMTQLLNTNLKKINLHRDEIRHLSVIQIEAIIDSGKHRMPKYGGKLTDSQIHDIASYVKILIRNEKPKEEKTSN